jgi:hypothetical protein
MGPDATHVAARAVYVAAHPPPARRQAALPPQGPAGARGLLRGKQNEDDEDEASPLRLCLLAWALRAHTRSSHSPHLTTLTSFSSQFLPAHALAPHPPPPAPECRMQLLKWADTEPDDSLRKQEMRGIGLSQPLLPAGGASSFAAEAVFGAARRAAQKRKTEKEGSSSRMWLETLSMAKDAIEHHARGGGGLSRGADPEMDAALGASGGGGAPGGGAGGEGKPGGRLQKKLSKKQLTRAALLWSRVAKMALPGRWSPRPDSKEAERPSKVRPMGKRCVDGYPAICDPHNLLGDQDEAYEEEEYEEEEEYVESEEEAEPAVE